MRALLVDWGGVLTTSVVSSFASFCETEGLDPERFRTAVLSAARTPGSPFERVEVGAISQEQFDEEVAALIGDACGAVVAPAGLKQRMFAATTHDAEMIDAVRAARAAGIRTGLVSNSWGGAGYPRELFDELFDGVVISGEVGLRKPDAAIFELACERVGVEPGVCVFVDDFRVNVEGAEALGMVGVRHRTAGETIPVLERALGVSLSRSPGTR